MKQRIITGLIGGFGFLYLVWLGKLPYSLLILILAAIGYKEFLNMNKVRISSIQGLMGLLSVILILLGLNPLFPFLEEIPTITIIIISLWLMLILVVLLKNVVNFDHISILMAGVLYISFGFGFMLKTRLLEQGFAFTLLVLIATWASDSGAYFTGKYFGKNKLWPQISPKKTIEGSIGGIFFAVVFSMITNHFLHISNDISSIISAGVFISIIGQIGDLVESALKRSKGVKDSGNLLPGHGGVLDRFDSLIFVFPIFYIVHTL